MARGKYATKAERRASFTSLEERAADAERERDRLAAELAGLRESSDRRIAGLRTELGKMRKQRDEATTPRLAELEEANSQLRDERDAAAAGRDDEHNKKRKFVRRVERLLRERFGLPPADAQELVLALLSGQNRITPM
jgi:hypothetical protein